MKKILLLPLLLITIYAQGNFSGVTYFDYSYDLTNDTTMNNSFGLNRVYFTYQQELSKNLSYKFQTDVGQLDVIELPGDGLCCSDTKTQKTQFVAYLKKAQLDWKTLYGKLTFGMQGMNIFNVTEKTWGFRFLEKSAMDKYGFSSSADIGIGFHGFLPGYNNLNLNYSILITNGTGYKNSENDKHKKTSVQLVYGEKNLSKNNGINIGASFAMEPYDFTDDKTKDKILTSLYGGFAQNGLRIGLEFDTHTDNGTDINQQIIAGYTSYKVSDKLTVLGRVDMWTKSIDNFATVTNEEKDSQTNIITGFNYIPAKGLTITPNVRMSIPEVGDETVLLMLNFEFKF